MSLHNLIDDNNNPNIFNSCSFIKNLDTNIMDQNNTKKKKKKKTAKFNIVEPNEIIIPRSQPIDIKQNIAQNEINILTPIETHEITRSEPNEIKSYSLPTNLYDNMNYSIYVDKQLSLSLSPDVDKTLYLKTNEKWVDSKIIIKCQNCNTSFSFMIRKHHCRACGSIFCYKCCNKYIDIPQDLVTKPKEESRSWYDLSFYKNRYMKYMNGINMLVCNDCNNRIKQLSTVKDLIQIFSYLNLKDLYNVSQVSKNYNTAAKYHIGKFKDIQYKTINIPLDRWEIEILWNIKHTLLSHNIWFISLIKTIYTYTNNYRILSRLEWLNCILETYLTNNITKKVKCWSLLCSRKCQIKLDFDDIIDLLEFISNIMGNDEFWNNKINMMIIILLLKILSQQSIQKPFIYIPILCKVLASLLDKDMFILPSLFYDNIFDSIIKIDNMITKESIMIAYYIIFEYKYILNNDMNSLYYFNFFKNIEHYIKKTIGPTIFSTVDSMILSINNIIDNKEIDTPFINPFNPHEYITKIISRSIIKSNTNPILVEVQVVDKDNNNTRVIKFIIKKDINLRKEQIISCLINCMQHKLQKSSSFEEIPTYMIVIISKDIGLIEYIEDSITLRMINENGFTLQNYILNQNKDQIIETIKKRFVNSLGISSAISYIIGLGDRHLDNIMICNNGMIFHIDYGYVLENPTTLFELPQIKVTNDIIDFLEGYKSKYYEDFKILVIKTYNILRANKNLLYLYFKFIADEYKIDWNTLQTKLDTRTMIGINYKDIEIILINEIDSANSLSNMFADLCHMYKQKIFK
jgi:hypothetical protein